MDWRDTIFGHEKLTDLARKSLIQSREGPLEMKPNLKKMGGYASLRRGREDSEGAGEFPDPMSV